MQHCKIVTIGDCSKAETRAYFERSVLPHVPDNLRPALDFEELYEAFGGRLVHWQDYTTDYGGYPALRMSKSMRSCQPIVNSGGRLRSKS